MTSGSGVAPYGDEYGACGSIYTGRDGDGDALGGTVLGDGEPGGATCSVVDDG